jgi:putative membrane protein
VKTAVRIGAVLGLALLVILAVRSDLTAIARTLAAGGLNLFWLVPYRTLFYALYAVGWILLLHPVDPTHRAGFGYVLWVTMVRDAVDRLLPVASVGGSVVGIRLLLWRGLRAPPVAATVIVEILLTLIVVYLFIALGLVVMLDFSAGAFDYRRLLVPFLLTVPVPAATVAVLRYGSVAARLHRLLGPWLGDSVRSEDARALDAELRAALQRVRTLMVAGTLQFLAFVSGSVEIWFALRLFGHPVSAASALVLESLIQAVRHLAFAIPAGIGIQEAGFVVFGHALGISAELALAVSMAKRLREIACGVPTLVSWQWAEAVRLHRRTALGSGQSRS